VASSDIGLDVGYSVSIIWGHFTLNEATVSSYGPARGGVFHFLNRAGETQVLQPLQHSADHGMRFKLSHLEIPNDGFTFFRPDGFWVVEIRSNDRGRVLVGHARCGWGRGDIRGRIGQHNRERSIG
jgi:hypothetical protein